MSGTGLDPTPDQAPERRRPVPKVVPIDVVVDSVATTWLRNGGGVLRPTGDGRFGPSTSDPAPAVPDPAPPPTGPRSAPSIGGPDVGSA